MIYIPFDLKDDKPYNTIIKRSFFHVIAMLLIISDKLHMGFNQQQKIRKMFWSTIISAGF